MSSNKNGLGVVALFAVALGLLACGGSGGGGSGGGDGGAGGGSLPEAVAYVKASNTGRLDGFSISVALSADGNTLAVGAFGEDSNATGIGGNQADSSAFGTGAVYVFTRSNGTWSQEAYVKASNSDRTDQFGQNVALSADGNTLAVGASGEGSNATGIGGNQADNSANNSGAVYVFTRSNGTWSQEAYVKASNTDAGDHFGESIALSADGDALVVGALREGSNATGIGGNQADNSAVESGAVYVFTRSDGTWSQEAYVKASNTEARDGFGISIALSADGNTLAVGARLESSNATGIGGNQADNSAFASGAVYVFTRTNGTWSQEAYVKASNTEAEDWFGWGVALSADGNTLAVAPFRDHSAEHSGAVYVFTRSSGTWSQEAYVKASNTEAFDGFGWGVTLSADGNTLAAGAGGEDSNATGIGGNQADDSSVNSNSGAAYVFTRSNGTWSQEAYVKASNTGVGDGFGQRVALSFEGNTLAVGAIGESSNATGIGGNQADNSADRSGAVYVYSHWRATVEARDSPLLEALHMRR